MFFIFWGEKSKDEIHGAVGDFCPHCERPRIFTVADRFTASHVYYITLSGWKFHAHVKTCWECGTAFYARLKDYESFIDLDEADRTSFREIVRRTNPPLAEWIAERKRDRQQRDEVRRRADEGE